MELQSISRISKQFDVSARTLRYYEQIGLIEPIKTKGLTRIYDENTVLRLNQIIILRKLRIPLKQIADILNSGKADVAIEIFQQNLKEIEDEITSLSTIKNVIKSFLSKLNIQTSELQLLDDVSLLELVDSLTVSKINFKEDKSMDDLNKANETLSKLKNVRIIYLPPATIAASHAFGKEAEEMASKQLESFITETGLAKIKPDLRWYGFDAPFNDDLEKHGHEFWVTIPDDMDVPAPLIKKHFEGGLYAAHTIAFGAFEEWGDLHEWAMNNPKYEGNGGSKAEECMWGCMEEHLNYINHIGLPSSDYEMQLDLLFPIKERNK